MNSKLRFPRKLYTVYRGEDDAILVFEETAERAAELLGIKRTTLYEQCSRQKHRVRSEYRIEVTRIAELNEEEDDGEW